MITTTKLSDEEADVWHEKIEEIFAVLDDTDTAVAINLLTHMAVGLAISHLTLKLRKLGMNTNLAQR